MNGKTRQDRAIAGRQLHRSGQQEASQGETKSLIILPTLKGAEYQAVKDLGFGRRLAVVSEVTTHEILGGRIEGSLAALYDVTSIVLPRNPYPDGETVEKSAATASAMR